MAPQLTSYIPGLHAGWQTLDCMQYIPMYTSRQQKYGPETSLCLARSCFASKFDVDLLFMSVFRHVTPSGLSALHAKNRQSVWGVGKKVFFLCAIYSVRFLT